MKYLRYMILVLVFVMVPFIAYANTCDNADIKIQGLELLEKTGSTVELNEAELVNNKISTDVKMYEVGDSIRYQFTVVNDSDNEYALDRNSLMLSNDTIDYKLESTDNSYIIDKNSSKDFTLTATYTNEVDASLFKGGKYEVGLNDIVEIKDPSLINPFTGNMFYYLIIILSIICIVFVVKGKKKKVLLVALFGLLFVPFSTYALCTYTLDLDVGLKIGNIMPTYCTYDGEIEYGTEYVNGQFTYYYGKEFKYINSISAYNWSDIGDGWSVQLNDTNAESVITPLCTYINDIPIISLAAMFRNSKATTIDTSSYDTSHIIDMNCMFVSCYSLESIDASNFDTSNVIDMLAMFCDCYVKSLNLSNFDTSKVEDMSWMFEEARYLSSLDLSNFDTSNVKNMREMFYYCESLISLDVSNFDTSKVTNMYEMFCYCYALTSLDLSSFNTPNVTDMGYMFYECHALTSLDVSNFDTSNITYMSYMFYECYELTYLDLSNFNTSNVTTFYEMFECCHNLETLNISNFSFDSLSDYDYLYDMFDDCYSLTTLYLSNIDISRFDNCDYFYEMTNDLYYVTTLYFDDIDMTRFDNYDCVYETFEYFLYNCDYLETVYARNWKLPDDGLYGGLYYVFYEICDSIKTIDVSGWDLSNVSSLDYMFGWFYDLETIIGLDTWDISNVTSMYEMFYDCYDLVTIDLSSFDMSNVTNTNYMFYDCTSLTTVYARTQDDIDKLSASSNLPSGVQFEIKSV